MNIQTKKTCWKFLINLSPSLQSEDDHASTLFEYGAESVEIKGQDKLEAYFLADKAELDNIKRALSNDNNFQISEVLEIEEKNWTQENLDVFKEIKLDKLKIIPVSSNIDPKINENDLYSTIYIIPGEGFGTGHHPTTRMIIKELQKIHFKPQAILDIGTGSGILSIASRKLWKNSKIVAFDNDPSAINNAKDNLLINLINDIELKVTETRNIKEQYPLVIANLYAELLIKLAPEIDKVCQSNSTLILSGILEEKSVTVKNIFQTFRFNSINECYENGWCCLTLNKII